MANELNSYELMRTWFDWCFENPELVNPNHTAIYCFSIEHCNRLGWKEKFGFPTQMTMEALGIKKHQTYIKYFNDLVEWNFIKLIQKSQNQYSANIISLLCAKPKKGKALDKANINHRAKQIASIGQSTGQSNSPIDKQINKEQINQLTNKPYREFAHLKLFDFEFENLLNLGFTKNEIDSTLDKIENYKKNTNYKSLYLTSKNWLEKDKEKSSVKKESGLKTIIDSRNEAHERIIAKHAANEQRTDSTSQ